MRLFVETFQREGDGGFVAIAATEGTLLSEAGVQGDSSERRSIIGAIHAYFNRQERPAVVTVHEPHPVDEWVASNPVQPLPSILDVARDQSTIELMLKRAVEARKEALDGDLAAANSKQFSMIYVDQGGVRTVRTIIPSEVERRERGSGFPETYLVAYDVAKDEPRTFRVDRIERLEAI